MMGKIFVQVSVFHDRVTADVEAIHIGMVVIIVVSKFKQQS